eukprot:5629891-Prymnesium_polylepis.3
MPSTCNIDQSLAIGGPPSSRGLRSARTATTSREHACQNRGINAASGREARGVGPDAGCALLRLLGADGRTRPLRRTHGRAEKLTVLPVAAGLPPGDRRLEPLLGGVRLVAKVGRQRGRLGDAADIDES